MKLLVEQKIIMRNRKSSKSSAMAGLLTVLQVSIFVLCNMPSMIEGGPVQNPGSDVNSTADSSEDYCQTRLCNITASVVRRYMDPNVDPCDNFYRYACGGFINSTIIPNDITGVDEYYFAKSNLIGRLVTNLAAPITLNEWRPLRLAKNFFRSCMNARAAEAGGLTPSLTPLRTNLINLGGWPVVDGDSWNETNFDWINSTYKFSNAGYGYHFFISFDIDMDSKNKQKIVLSLDDAELQLSRNYLLGGFDDKVVSAYYRYMVEIAVLLGAEKNRAMDELKDALSFQIKLANITLPMEEKRNATKFYNPMTLEELTKNYPSIPWREFFTRMLPSSVTVEENERVIVKNPNYISELEKLISKTPKRVLANYAIWHAIEDSAPYLGSEIRQPKIAFDSVLNGRQEALDFWSDCLQQVSDAFPVALSAVYIRQYFFEDDKKNAIELTADIKEQVKGLLMEADWMDNKTRKNALEKVAAMSSYVAYPDELLENDKVEKFYANLEMSEDNYLENALNYNKFLREYKFGKLHESFNATEWIYHSNSIEVNAFYSLTNSIDIPAGILQGAFFMYGRPQYMNYGGIGGIIGHEMIHAFDDQGSQYDKNGNLNDWWEPSTKMNYLNRTKCIIDQYSNYTLEEVNLKINGIVTQGENIADNGGLKAAYRAYNQWVSRNGQEKKLSGIDLTPQQMFWLSYANERCSITRRESMRERINTDEHSPTEFRTVGPFSNMPEFARDYNCPVGSKMNPEKKCVVW